MLSECRPQLFLRRQGLRQIMNDKPDVNVTLRATTPKDPNEICNNVHRSRRCRDHCRGNRYEAAVSDNGYT